MSWITGKEATDILSANSGRPIPRDYIRTLAKKSVVRSRTNPKNPSTVQYWLEDVKDRKVRGRTEKRSDAGEESDEQEPLARVG